MSEHGKGLELAYNAERGEFVASGLVMGFLVPPPGAPREAGLATREALGYQMAAVPELIEAVRMALWVMARNDGAVGEERRHAYEKWLAEARERYSWETGLAPDDADGYGTPTFERWCGGSHDRVMAAMRTALRIAGVEP